MSYDDCLEVFWQKLCKLDKRNCNEKILKLYNEKRFLVINFAYFAVLIKGGILDSRCNSFGSDFLKAHIILPDGIALRLWAQKKIGVNLENMNGDDFLRQFFKRLDKKNVDYIVIGYGGKQNINFIRKTQEEFAKISKRGFRNFYHGYDELPWHKLEKLKKYNGLKILLQSRGGPQEHWTVVNLKKIKEYGFLIFNVGGLFDHRSGYEPRAPKFLQKMRLEWLRRLLLNPQKNWPKVRDSLKVFREIMK